MVLTPITPTDKACILHCNNCGHSTDHHVEFCKLDFKGTGTFYLVLTCTKCKDDPHAFKRNISIPLHL